MKKFRDALKKGEHSFRHALYEISGSTGNLTIDETMLKVSSSEDADKSEQFAIVDVRKSHVISPKQKLNGKSVTLAEAETTSLQLILTGIEKGTSLEICTGFKVSCGTLIRFVQFEGISVAVNLLQEDGSESFHPWDHVWAIIVGDGDLEFTKA